MLPRSTEIAAGEPDGPVTVAPVSVDVTLLSFSPNGEPAASSATETTGVGGIADELDVVTRRRPVPPGTAPSACARSAITVFNPAWVAVPFMI